MMDRQIALVVVLTGLWALMLQVWNELRHTNTHLGDLSEHVQEQNGRVGQLEKWQVRVIAGVSAIFAVTPLAIPAVRESIGQVLAGG